MIRIAEEKDFEIVRAFAEELIKDSPYKQMFKDYSLTKYMYGFYTSNWKERACIIVIDGDKDIGFAAFDLIPWVNHDAPVKMARLVYLYLLPEYRSKGFGKEIYIAFEHWGKQVGATHYSISHKADGYTKVETIYMKEVN